MKCPFCGQHEHKVLHSRADRDGETVRRRRECNSCGGRFTTYEQIEDLRVMVVKRDGRREQFDRTKVIRGMIAACQKRPVPMETLEAITDRIEQQVYRSGEMEIESERIGEMVVEALRGVDQVAFVRFASVYRQFEDVGQFTEIISVLARRSRGAPRGAGRA